MDKHWSRLDNAGKIYPANINIRNTTLFRVSAGLKNDINTELLQQAVDEIMPRFPYFHVKLSKGFFWYYFIKTDKQVIIKEDLYYPCTEWNFKEFGFLFSVKYKKREISAEFSHSITDGGGAIEFFKSLILRYFQLKGIQVADAGEIKVPGEAISPEEYSDSFKEFYNVHIPAKEYRNIKAFQLSYKPTENGVYHVTTGSMPLTEIKEVASKKKVNLTTLICLFYFQVFQQIIYEQKAKPAPIIINLPINLRNIFGSKTMHNFFVSITPSIDPRIGFFSEKDIIKHVQNYLHIEIDRRYVGKMIKRNIKIEKRIFIRIMPLFIKELIMPMVYNLWGERGYSSGISNLGSIKFPPDIEDQLVSFNVIPPPSPGNLVKMICFSFKNRFYVTFGSLTDDKTVEKKFFRLLRKTGINIKIKSV